MSPSARNVYPPSNLRCYHDLWSPRQQGCSPDCSAALSHRSAAIQAEQHSSQTQHRPSLTQPVPHSCWPQPWACRGGSQPCYNRGSTISISINMNIQAINLLFACNFKRTWNLLCLQSLSMQDISPSLSSFWRNPVIYLSLCDLLAPAWLHSCPLHSSHFLTIFLSQMFRPVAETAVSNGLQSPGELKCNSFNAFNLFECFLKSDYRSCDLKDVIIPATT